MHSSKIIRLSKINCDNYICVSISKYPFIHDYTYKCIVVSMLLQLGSAGIVLSKKRKSSAPEMKEDLWIKFRETANATGALVSVQTPFIVDAADQKG